MKEQAWIHLFITYLQLEKNSSIHTTRNYTNDITDFVEYMKAAQIVSFLDVKGSDAADFLSFLFNREYSRATISRKVSSLRSFFKFHMKEGRVSENPFATVILPKRSNQTYHTLSEDQMVYSLQLVSGASPLEQRDRAILELLYGTGIKVSECAKIKITDLNLSLGTILIEGKSRKERYLPVGKFALEALQTYINDGRNVLLQKTNQPQISLFLNVQGLSLSDRSIRSIIKKRIGVECNDMKLRPYDIRHSFTSHLLKNGADVKVVQDLLGNEQLIDIRNYTDVTKDRLQDVYKHFHPRA
ncbi:site-specific tyrosine recombinase [Halalkalibacter wakoensis JCM 9140]|uniref:Site-specific tyrosine recombinase n=1 Tax=Halalkalibacter wakoensis JCM 9140 TaxID=1236970 RepID=W4PXN6_9BACI|nr:tyrosine-type recombinase/integrase [Halalkalibacter wakoensis]GAE24243.1 site-specific tyrosine recombinase [Halalkalibacter wakoensis JCM 9140]